jgi:hypothetical protein
MCESYRIFPTLQKAMAYRHEHGTGGWIFEDEQTGEATLFPPHLSPAQIYTHRLTRGRSGRLIGSA